MALGLMWIFVAMKNIVLATPAPQASQEAKKHKKSINETEKIDKVLKLKNTQRLVNQICFNLNHVTGLV